MISAEELLALLDRTLTSSVTPGAVAGDEVELSVRTERLGTTRFANSRVTQTGDVEEVTVQARIARGTRVGSARTSGIDPESLKAVIVDAGVLAAGQPEDPRFSGFADGGTPVAAMSSNPDPEIAAGDPRLRADRVGAAFRLCAGAGLSAAGLAAGSHVNLAVATSRGARRAFSYTTCKLDVIASDAETSAREGRMATRLAALDGAELAERAVELAQKWRSPVELSAEPTGTPYDVVLGPAAVAEVLEWLSLIGLGARSVEEGSSFMAGRFGERIAGALTVYDDAVGQGDAVEDCPHVPFDSEGTPTARLSLIAEGVACAVAHDRGTASLLGVRSTGHAPPLGDDLFDGGAVPQHLHIAAGGESTAQLLAKVEHGLWVPRFHYVNGLLDTRRALMTGMTRDGLFRIEDGKVGRGVRNLRWTESLLEAFARLEGATRLREVVSGSLGDSFYVCPSLLIRGFRFTGKSQ